MKKLIASILCAFLFLSSICSQNPKKGFPYYYYDKKEKSFSEYERYFEESYYNEVILIEENDEHIIRMAKYDCTYFIWTQYKVKVSEGDIKHTLKAYKDIAANLDSRLDKKMRYNTNVCFIFTDSRKNLICSALYCEE